MTTVTVNYFDIAVECSRLAWLAVIFSKVGNIRALVGTGRICVLSWVNGDILLVNQKGDPVCLKQTR
jgi:hypothetical protein